MPHGDDLDARFNEVVSQIGADEQRRMRTAATRGVKPAAPPQPARRPRRPRGLLAIAVVITVLAAAGTVVAFRPDLVTPATAPVRPALALETQPVTEKPEPVGPFTDSRAEKFADGMAGFVTPKAKALAGLSKKEVAAGLNRAGKLFSTAFLDRKTLLGGKPKAFIAQLDAEERPWYRKRPRIFVNSFAPKTAELVTDVIKVHGRTTVAKSTYHGRPAVEVKTNYLVVYAIRRPGDPDTTVRLVTHPRGELFLLRRSDGGVATVVQRWRGTATPARCDVKDDFIHPEYRDSAPGKVKPTGPPVDPYDLDQPVPKGCGSSKRT